jgi:hypothetical protein
MRPARPFFRYRRDLKARARDLRRDPTPAERKLWFNFLSTHFEKSNWTVIRISMMRKNSTTRQGRTRSPFGASP